MNTPIPFCYQIVAVQKRVIYLFIKLSFMRFVGINIPCHYIDLIHEHDDGYSPLLALIVYLGDILHGYKFTVSSSPVRAK